MAENNFKMTTLKNGLTILGEPMPHAKSASVGFFVRTGSRDETPVESGVSHFLEHMMFKGTAKRSSLDVTYALGNIGAQANAYTSEENTVYYGSVVPEYLGDMHELLSDMLRPSLDPAEFDMEKKVILEEIALYQDRPHFYLYDTATSDYFGSHPAGNSVLGSTQSISALTRDQMKQYFDRRYAPGNMVLAAAGNFDWARFVADTERYCDGWADFKAPRALAQHAPTEKRISWTMKDLTQSHLLLLTSGPSAQEPERYPFALLSMIIGDGSGSRIYWDLVDPGLVESAGADSDERDGTGCFLASASMEPEKIEMVTEKIRTILNSPREFSEADLERAKNKLTAKIVLSGELPMGRLMAIGSEWHYRHRIESLAEVIAKIRAVTRGDIEAALERYPLKVWSEYRLVPE